jgi:amidase
MTATIAPQDTDLTFLSLAGLGQALRERRISPVEITSLMLDRIDRLQPRLYPYRTVMRETALAEARRAEEEITAGDYRGPMHGVPYAAKDLCYTLDAPTAFGSAAYGNWIAPHESTVTARLRQAGAVLLGKLHMTEGAVAAHHPAIPMPVNPWGSGRWPGVSSSGSGVATAAGLCFGSLGSDTGGSIRFPSGACGLTGMKPTWGRVSRHGIVPLSPSYDHIGPITRTAEDAAIMLQVIAGHDANDPTSLRAPVPDYLAALAEVPRGLRIGIDEVALIGIEPAIRRALDHVVETLRAVAAARVAPIVIPDQKSLLQACWTIISAELAVAHEPMDRAAGYGQSLIELIQRSRRTPTLDIVRAFQRRADFAGRFRDMFDEIDLLVLPVLPVGTPPAEIMTLERMADEQIGVGRYSVLLNATGSPSLTIAAGFDDNAMPIGIQLIGPHLLEDRLLALGHAFQQATDWHLRRPPLYEAGR